MTRKDAQSITDAESPGRVISFAQTDVIDRLLGGADPRFVDNTADFIENALKDLGSKIEKASRGSRVSKAKVAEREKIIAEIAELTAQQFVNVTAPKLRGFFTQEFDSMIALMPKQELVDLAEALVNITAVERKASSDEGTVGGPIDVAMITKHEGFVWIKRKQYFQGHLNPRYFWRRYGRVGDRGEHAEDALRQQRASARRAEGHSEG